MAEPTGGDWRVALRSFNPQWRGDGTEVLSDYGRIAETHVNGLRDIEECRANARLIAAAPDMLEALRLAQRWLANCAPVVEIDGPKPLPAIAAAIAKATESLEDAPR